MLVPAFSSLGGAGHGSVSEPPELPYLPLSWVQALLLFLSTMTAKP